MSEYTPTTGDIRLGYIELVGQSRGTTHSAADAEFARWLAAHDAKVRAKALDGAGDEMWDGH